MAKLILTRDGRTIEYAVVSPLNLGRGDDNNITIPDTTASRHHARIVVDSSGDSWIQDLKSANGTYVNHNRIVSPTCLRENDHIRIGRVQLTYSSRENDPHIRSIIGGYEILTRVGIGGMGTVYLANQLSMQREVALKIMRPELAERPGFVENFSREARLAARLNHPNIIHIVDFGNQGSTYFFSMEFVHGEDLLDRLEREGPLPVPDLLAVGIQTCNALHHAHEQGILHQDVKPHNLMINTKGQVKVADLGLACTIQFKDHLLPDNIESAENSDKSGEGDKTDRKRPIMGTPHYISPEAIRRQPLDARSDLYSLSATLYHLATGKPPFNGETSKDILRHQCFTPAPDPREVNPRIPERLAKLIMRGMSKNREDRPVDAIAYRDELIAIQKSLQNQQQILTPDDSAKNNDKSANQVAKTEGTITAAVKVTSNPSQTIKNSAESISAQKSDNGLRRNKWTPLVATVFFLLSIIVAFIIAVKAFGYYSDSQAKKALSNNLLLLKDGNLDEAETGLQHLIVTYPSSTAAKEAEKFLKEKMPHALLTRANELIELGKKEQARLWLEKIVKEYPQSTEYLEAQRILTAMRREISGSTAVPQ